MAKFKWNTDPKQNHYQMTYKISHSCEKYYSVKQLTDILSQVNIEVRNFVWTGWSMFYPFSRKEIAPKPIPEHEDGSGKYILQTNLAEEGRVYDTGLPDFWQVSPNGWATIIRLYREDRGRIDDFRKPGNWLSPETPVRETAEFVRHAATMASYFHPATSVSFECYWSGLMGRKIADFSNSVHWSYRENSSSDVRKTKGSWPIGELVDDWPNIVSSLACPVLELFGIDFCNVDFVKSMKPKFIKLPPTII